MAQADDVIFRDTNHERSASYRDGRYARREQHPTRHEHAPLLSHVGVSVDFGKDWPVLPEGQYLELAPELVELCENALEEPCETVHLFT